jgi:hypothetical protein
MEGDFGHASFAEQQSEAAQHETCIHARTIVHLERGMVWLRRLYMPECCQRHRQTQPPARARWPLSVHITQEPVCCRRDGAWCRWGEGRVCCTGEGQAASAGGGLLWYYRYMYVQLYT